MPIFSGVDLHVGIHVISCKDLHVQSMSIIIDKEIKKMKYMESNYFRLLPTFKKKTVG